MTETTRNQIETQPTKGDGLDAARRYAGWQLGDRSWADLILRAYLNPAIVNADLDEVGAPPFTGWDAD
jgi:hypothetical protein